MKISSLIIVMVLVSAVIVSLYAIVIDLENNPYIDVDVNTSQSNTYNKVTELMDETNTTQTKIIDILSKEDRSFFTGAWDAYKVTKETVFGVTDLTVGSIGIANALLLDLQTDLGMPSIVYSTLIIILTVLVISAMLFLLIKRRW